MKKIKIYCLFILLISYTCPVFVNAETIIDDYKLDEPIEKNTEVVVENEPESTIENDDKNTEITTSQEKPEMDNLENESEIELSDGTKQENNEQNLRVIIATGLFGTSKWQIDNTGVLHIGSGEFINTKNSSPWFLYRNQINKVVFDGPVKASSNSSHLFSNLDRVTEFENLSELDTSAVTLMRDMFSNLSSLKSLDLSNFNTSKVTDMGFMFTYMSSLVDLNVSSFDTSNVVYMRSMFLNTQNIGSLDLSSFDTSSVEDMSGMFYGSGIKHLDITHFNTSNVDDMSGMFSNLTLDSLDLSNFNTEKVRNMSDMFSWSAINDLDVSNFNTSLVKSMSDMFSETQMSRLDLSNFDTGNVTNINNMFSNSKINSLDISSFDTSRVVYMYEMFARMNELKHINLGENFQFKDEVTLPAPSNSLPYYGKWQRDHKGEAYTSDELAEQYDGLTMNGNYYWAEKQPTLEVRDSIIYEGDTWDPIDNFISAADEDGNILPFSSSMTTDSVNTDIPGSYEVTYRNGTMSKTIIVIVKENLETLDAKDSMIYVDDTWKSEDNFLSATNRDGQSIEFNTSMTADIVNTSIPGIYHVTYTNGRSSKTIEVIVKENKESINANDSIIYVGDDWKGHDNFVSATDKDGNELSYNDAMLTGVVDTKTPGIYSVDYTNGQAKSKIAVTVKENQLSIQANDSTIKVGDRWKAEDNFKGATDKDGGQISFKDITVIGNVDTSKAGRYEITYAYDTVVLTVVVFVEENNKEINGDKDNYANKDEINLKNQNTTKKITNRLFPKTGEQNHLFLVIFGLFISMLSVILLNLRKDVL